MSRSLNAWLEEAQVRGLIGPRELPSAVDHARALGAVALDGFAGSKRALDVGSGGGLPGLVLAVDWPDWSWTLLDSSQRSAEFLAESVADLGLAAVSTVQVRAEDHARQPENRSAYGLVMSRSVAPLGVMCEYAAPLLEVGGRLIVSQPPLGQSVPGEVLERLGMEHERLTKDPSAAVIRQVQACPMEFPRRTGVALKRPLS